jgi:hypothetical protein
VTWPQVVLVVVLAVIAFLVWCLLRAGALADQDWDRLLEDHLRENPMPYDQDRELPQDVKLVRADEVFEEGKGGPA